MWPIDSQSCTILFWGRVGWFVCCIFMISDFILSTALVFCFRFLGDNLYSNLYKYRYRSTMGFIYAAHSTWAMGFPLPLISPTLWADFKVTQGLQGKVENEEVLCTSGSMLHEQNGSIEYNSRFPRWPFFKSKHWMKFLSLYIISI